MVLIRVRGPSGMKKIDVDESLTWNQLRMMIEESTGIQADRQQILGGFPPLELNYDGNLVVNGSLANGDLLTVQQLPSGVQNPSKVSETQTGVTLPPKNIQSDDLKPSENGQEALPTTASYDSDPNPNGSIASQGTFEVVVVPDDNSCLFRSVLNVLDDENRSVYTAERLRTTVAEYIRQHPLEFTSAVLGQDPDQYISWILMETSWGGGIELAIFARVFEMEFDAIDIQSLRIDRFGEGSGYNMRALLIYDGIHYNSIELKIGGIIDVRQFPIDDEYVLHAAMQIAIKANAERAYTDTAGFQLRCADCGTRLEGEKQAVQHATSTGHTNFRES
eukprot:CAMPEP_0182452492 /NCGR_PEP_ID=MMETSP1172-20130603/44275_1 /TAXON_ID=708627 /ORGANISM="Timspurckia oligopyrenoides, Strain CCMP3278" /LENGTH=333 /DNA_ID=CAMNT_0024650327 /DNA_START=80 /DNA_END=1081 /DNA_ORIENTATION=-